MQGPWRLLECRRLACRVTTWPHSLPLWGSCVKSGANNWVRNKRNAMLYGIQRKCLLFTNASSALAGAAPSVTWPTGGKGSMGRRGAAHPRPRRRRHRRNTAAVGALRRGIRTTRSSHRRSWRPRRAAPQPLRIAVGEEMTAAAACFRRGGAAPRIRRSAAGPPPAPVFKSRPP
jgi:hypothetical protein